MPRVTIGVPVYNAESLLEQCLENLAAQTFRDLKVIVLDNASTDGTGAIAQRFAARDSRFTYIRQPHNKGARQNFADVLAMADTPYFMWRADDDLSDVNFVEETVRLLDATPGAGLAVGRTVLDKRGRRRLKTFPRQWPIEPKALYRVRVLLRSRAGWLFGLFRTEELRQSLKRVDAEYRHVNAFDHLTLFPFLIQLRVIGSDASSFVTGFIERETSAKKGSFMAPQTMETLRRDFLRYCAGRLPELTGSRVTSTLMTPVLWLYAERTYRWVKVLSARMRVAVGQQPFGVTTKYD
jgi:glycosyltransferase involved in cell wall biosynthesis